VIDIQAEWQGEQQQLFDGIVALRATLMQGEDFL
jgi:hypothetical protein